MTPKIRTATSADAPSPGASSPTLPASRPVGEADPAQPASPHPDLSSSHRKADDGATRRWSAAPSKTSGSPTLQAPESSPDDAPARSFTHAQLAKALYKASKKSNAADPDIAPITKHQASALAQRALQQSLESDSDSTSLSDDEAPLKPIRPAANAPVGANTADWILKRKKSNSETPPELLVEELNGPLCNWFRQSGYELKPEAARRYLNMILRPRSVTVSAEGFLSKPATDWIRDNEEAHKDSPPSTFADNLQRWCLRHGYTLSHEQALRGIQVTLEDSSSDVDPAPASATDLPNAAKTEPTETTSPVRTKRRITRDARQIDDATRDWIGMKHEETAYKTREMFARALCGWHSALKGEEIDVEDATWLLQAVLDTANEPPDSSQGTPSKQRPAPQQSDATPGASASSSAETVRPKRSIPRDPDQIQSDTRDWIQTKHEERAYQTLKSFAGALCGWHSAVKGEEINQADARWLLQTVLHIREKAPGSPQETHAKPSPRHPGKQTRRPKTSTSIPTSDRSKSPPMRHTAESSRNAGASGRTHGGARRTSEAWTDSESFQPSAYPSLTDTRTLSYAENEWRRQQPPLQLMRTGQLLQRVNEYIDLAYQDYRTRQNPNAGIPHPEFRGREDLPRALDSVVAAMRLLEQGDQYDRAFYVPREQELRWVYDELRRRTLPRSATI